MNEDWLNTSEGEIYTDGYKPGDPLGNPVPYEQKIMNDPVAMRGGVFFSEGSAEERLNQITEDLQEVQDRVAGLSDEPDEDMLENIEGELDIVIAYIGDVIEDHG